MWKVIPNSHGIYLVSSNGKVKSIGRHVRAKRGFLRWVRGRIMKTGCGSHGYPEVRLSIDGKATLHLVHRLVATAFIPNPDNKPEVNHKDGNKQNNQVHNLEWVTYREQRTHAYKTGLQKGPIGSKNYLAILTEKDIPTIRKRLADGERQIDIARDYGVSFGIINLIKRGITWRHIPCPEKQDLSKTPTFAAGNRNGSARLSEDAIPTIRGRIAAGEPDTKIAKDFQVTPGTIRLIRIGKTWRGF